MAERAGELGRFLDGDLPLLDRAFTSIRERFQGGSPSLLHGDLWPGNVLFDADGPLLIDPAVSFGHHEMDIAFGQMAPHTTFPPAFYAAYERRRPSAPGYAGRRPAWQLWPLLTHLVQDGDGWRSQLMEAIEEIVDG